MLEQGDRVLDLQSLEHVGHGKTRAHWEQNIYVAVKQYIGIPVILGRNKMKKVKKKMCYIVILCYLATT